jgi:hypothetical protein
MKLIRNPLITTNQNGKVPNTTWKNNTRNTERIIVAIKVPTAEYKRM